MRLPHETARRHCRPAGAATVGFGSGNRCSGSPAERARYRRVVAIRVECYAGYRGEQEPTAFWLGDRRVAVREIMDRWFAPGQRWFRVDADDGHLYVLRHDEARGEWELAAFTRAAG